MEAKLPNEKYLIVLTILALLVCMSRNYQHAACAASASEMCMSFHCHTRGRSKRATARSENAKHISRQLNRMITRTAKKKSAEADFFLLKER